MLSIICDTVESIKPVSWFRLKSAQYHLDLLTKPPGNLGFLEELAKKYTAIQVHV